MLREKVSGSEIIYPLMELARDKKYKVFFFGGFDFGNGNTGLVASKNLKKKYPGLDIVGVYPGKRKSRLHPNWRIISKRLPNLPKTIPAGLSFFKTGPIPA